MSYQSSVLTYVALVLAAPLLVSAQQTPTAAQLPPILVTRYGLPLAQYQTRVMNEATKLSLACRMFRSLYGRWPNDLTEIQARSEGIDFEVFAGKAVVTPLPDDSEKIEIFDGVNTRAVKAVPVDLGVTDAAREAAKAPGFKIKLRP